MIAIWLGQIISEYGIQQQGLSLIIFSGIVSQLPSNLVRILADRSSGWYILLISIIIFLVSIFAIVYLQQGTRYVKLMIPGQRLGYRGVKSGGTLSTFSILAMGVYPYITASIILQLLGPIIPSIQDKLKNDPKEGRKWMEKWTMYLSIPLAFLSAIGQIGLFNQILPGYTVLKDFGWSGSSTSFCPVFVTSAVFPRTPLTAAATIPSV